MSRASQFYQVGAALASDVRSYVERAADEELYQQVREGRFCYVLTTRQMGKTSLMVRTAERLRAEGTQVVTVDLTGFGTHEHSITADQWYYGIAETVVDDLGLDQDVGTWWDQGAKLPPLQRLLRFLRDVVLAKTSGPVVIFVDEIDSTLNLSFAGDFFAGIRSCYNARAKNPEFDRLTFVLLGVASPTDLISDPRRTPFNIGTAIHLTDFTLREALPLAEGLGGEPAGREEALERVLYWTGGHPYLTQKVCLRAADASRDRVSPDDIDRLVDEEFIAAGADRREPNLSFVRNRILDRGALTLRLLRLYRRVLSRKAGPDNPTAPVQTELKLSGLVKVSDYGALVVRNEIYRRVFGEEWIKEVWPCANTSTRLAVAAVILLLLSPLFWYEVLYPRQFIDTLRLARGEEVNLAHDAYEHLRRIPFYRGRAATLWGEFHARRAARETSRGPAILLWLMALKADPTREDYRRHAIQRVEPDYTRLVTTIVTAKGDPERTDSTDKPASIALSHDGRLLATGSFFGVLEVWDMDQPTAKRVLLKRHKGSIDAMTFNADGTRLATAGEDGSVRLWRLDQPTAEPVLLKGHNAGTFALALSADGTRLVAGGEDGRARLWRVDQPTAEPVLFKGHIEEIRAMAFCADGTRLVAVGPTGTAWLWRMDQPTAEPVLLKRHDERIPGVALSPDGSRLATVGEDGSVRLWRLNQPAAEAVLLKGQRVRSSAMAFSADGTRLVAGGEDGRARLWRVDQPTAEPVLFKGHIEEIRAVAFSADGTRLVTEDWYGLVRLWLVDQPTAKPLQGDPQALLAEWQKKLALEIGEHGEEMLPDL